MARTRIKPDSLPKRSIKIPKGYKVWTYQPVIGDVLFITPSKELSPADQEKIQKSVSKSSGCKVVVLPKGSSVSVVRA